MGRLDGKTAIVTGASSGMGKTTAIYLAKEGANVVMAARREEKLQDTKTEIENAGGKAITVKGDVSKESDWGKIVAQAISNYGKIDVLVNNAGTGGNPAKTRANEGFDQGEWDMVLNSNLFGVVYGVKAVVPEMIKIGGGSIINIGSISAISAMGGGSAYTASKGAVVSFTRGLASDLAKENIRANCILPGIIVTEMTGFINDEDNPMHKAIVPRWKQKIKLPFFGEGEDIANAALYLASNESRYVTGTEIVVDGGYTID